MVSLLTLFSMIRIWAGAFWSPPEDPSLTMRVARRVPRGGGPRLMVVPTAALVACSLAVAAAAGPVYALSKRAANDLIARDAYIEEVLRP